MVQDELGSSEIVTCNNFHVNVCVYTLYMTDVYRRMYFCVLQGTEM